MRDYAFEEWAPQARSVTDFTLDAAFETPGCCASWLLPAGSAPAPPVRLPDLPIVLGHVSSQDAADHPDALLAYYRQFPPMPPRRLRVDTWRHHCFGLGLLIDMPADAPVFADTFGGAHAAAAELLAAVADTGAGAGTPYDNLDQGWALRMVMAPDWIYTLEWNWEPDADADFRALRFPRAAMAAQAAAAFRRLARLHGMLTHALGRDLWRTGIDA